MLSLGLPALHIAPFFLYINVYQSSDVNSFYVQEQYYEVPHWMHLSFVSYESDDTVVVDHLSEKDQSVGIKEELSKVDELKILPNGFLLPTNFKAGDKSRSSSSTILGLSSFSAIGNVAASPKRKKEVVSKERQLITGRDFRDILEACRPRDASKVPTPLRAILGGFVVGRTAASFEHEHNEFKEWGTLDFNSLRGDLLSRTGRRTLSLGQESDEERMSLYSQSIGISPSRSGNLLSTAKHFQKEGDTPKSLDISSQSSSLASQISNTVLSVSYERQFNATRASSILPSVQLLRSNSLDRILDEGDDNSDTAVSTDTSIDSSDDEESQTGDISIRELIRKKMRAFDAVALVAVSPQVADQRQEPRRDSMSAIASQSTWVNSQAKPQGGSIMLPKSLQRPQAAATGGLGAALRQYRSTSSSCSARDTFSNGTALVRRESSGRVASNLNPSSFRFAEMGSRGMSPMLLPPVIGMNSISLAENHNKSISSRQTITENRFCHSQDILSRSGGRSPGANDIFNRSLLSRARVPIDEQKSLRSLSVSPPTRQTVGSPQREKNLLQRSRQEKVSPSRPSRERGRVPPSRSGFSSKHKKKALNPFRQKDEDDVLAKQSHNRKRWSHVFPVGEIEFKRHAGPNWKR
jgi:hypothetical protein